jgi:hypothetical protein
MCGRLSLIPLISLLSPLAVAGGTTEFCLDGEASLGARNQGMQPGVNEFVPTRWCVVTEDGSQRTLFSGRGKSNPYMEGNWTVAALPPETLVLNSHSAPQTPVSRLAKYRQRRACEALSD